MSAPAGTSPEPSPGSPDQNQTKKEGHSSPESDQNQEKKEADAQKTEADKNNDPPKPEEEKKAASPEQFVIMDETTALNASNKLQDYMSVYGFNDIIDDSRFFQGRSEDNVVTTATKKGGEPTQRRVRRRKSRNMVFYWGNPDDYSDDDEDIPIPKQPVIPVPVVQEVEAPKTDEGEAADEEEATEGEEEGDLLSQWAGGKPLPADTTTEPDDAEEEMWEDEEEHYEYDEDEEMDEEARIAAELEWERIKGIRMEAIQTKKEILIERYLKTARIMINLRKKNIFLQDYLYNLAFRKGVLRGDPTNLQSTRIGGGAIDSQLYAENLQRKRMAKKNALMSARFSRFLRKTGHISEEDQMLGIDHNRPQRNDHSTFGGGVDRINRMRNRLNRGYNANKSRRVGGSGKTCPKGVDCNKNQNLKGSDPKSVASSQGKAAVRQHLSIREIQRRDAAIASRKKALETTDVALDAFEKHRCKMKKQRQIIQIAKLLQRQFSGTTLLDQEKPHLVSFVETSVTTQNLAKKKAQRRQKKNLEAVADKKTGLVNMNHQWLKSLEKIRDLRLKKAKLEQDHKLMLMKKVQLWDTWEKRDQAALESVVDFIYNMASKVSLTRRETESFKEGMDQFRKQLSALFESMLLTLVRHCKAKSMLHMAQRKVKDTSSVASTSVKGFSLADFERMSIENRESHQKLVERQHHLVEQYQKLDQYIHKVADGHNKKQITWNALRAGRHDLKQLWQLCAVERDNLMRKWQDAIKAEQVHRRMFVQVAIVENKRVSLDFLRIQNRVRQLKDKKQTLAGKVRQTGSALRVIHIKTTEMQKTLLKQQQAKAEKAVRDEQNFYKDTIYHRFNPRLPNTIHSVNTRRIGSLHRILEPEPDMAIFNKIRATPSGRLPAKGSKIKFKTFAVPVAGGK